MRSSVTHGAKNPEWTPFERIVTQDTETMPVMKRLTWRNEYRLQPTATGTSSTISRGGFEGRV